MSSSEPSEAASVDSRDFLQPVFSLEGGRARFGWALGLAGAIIAHSSVAALSMTSLIDLRRYAQDVQAALSASLRTQIDVKVDAEPEPPPPPEPEVEPEPPPPEPVKTPPPVKAPDPEPQEAPPPPAAAEAAKVLTSEPDPNEPLDLTGVAFVTGEGQTYVGGTTATGGTSKKAVYDQRATGNGSGVAAKGPVSKGGGPNLTRRPSPLNRSWDDCGFPAEADIEQINQAKVTITVTVGPDGWAKSVAVLKDPGFGFGPLARKCALRTRFQPALDAAGQAVTATTSPITIRFVR